MKGDTLVVGAGNRNGHYVPDVYATEYGTLNLSVSKKLGKHFNLTFQARNLLNPEIEEVYRPPIILVTKRLEPLIQRVSISPFT